MFVPEFERPAKPKQRRRKRSRTVLPLTRVTDESGDLLCVIEGWGVTDDDVAAARALHRNGLPGGLDPRADQA